jgi:hypothetical protein
VCWSYKELRNAQFGIIPKIVRPATCRIWILPSSRQLGFLHLTIHFKYVRRQMMLIICCFVIIIMVDTIYSTSSWKSFKFPPTFELFIMFSCNTLISTQTMPCFSWLRFWGRYTIISSQPSLMHCIYMCVHLFLVD